MTPRRIALLAFPDLTLLDLVGPYDALRRVGTMGIDPDVTCTIVGTASPLSDGSGFTFLPSSVYEDLSGFDLLVVPGGPGTSALEEDARLLDYLKSWGTQRPLASVCTGSILLGRAGFLSGIRATTHHLSLDRLAPLCREVLAERVVDEGRVVTAAGVTSGLDLGLHLVGKYWGEAARVRIARQMEFER